MAKILRCWLNDFPNSRGQISGLVNICMRFSKEEKFLPNLQIMELPTSRENKTLQNHMIFGLFDYDSLVLLHDAIEEYLYYNKD